MSDVVEINVVVERLKERKEEVRETFHFDTILIFPWFHWHCFYGIITAGVNVTNDMTRYTRSTVVVLVYFFHLFSFLLKTAGRR